MNVLHFRDGSTSDFPTPPEIDMARKLVLTSGNVEFPFSSLKAVFFLNDEPRRDEPTERPTGSFLAVEFFDGEIIRGFARYNPSEPGFFLYPAEKGRNERVFVVAAAVQSVEIENV